MANVSEAMQAKSNQLNYDDIGNGEKIIFITNVVVKSADQPVAIYFLGCNNKPFMPSKGMIRLISCAYSEESDNWIGKSIKLYGDPTVRWAGAEIGGIRIRAFSHIEKTGISAFVALSRGKRRKTVIDYLEVLPTEDEAKWVSAIKANSEVINQLTDADYRLKIESFLN